MAEARSAWGIDIGQSGLKALKIRQDESGQIVAEAFDYIQFPKILSQPDAVPEEIVPGAMQTFLSRNDLKGSTICISVPGQSALARFIQLPPVESSKLHEIVKYEARQQIPFALEDVIWDYQPLGAGSEQGGFLLDAEVGLFAMKKDQVYQQLRPYNNAKVEVDLIQIAPLALYSVLSVDELGIRRGAEAEAADEYSIVLDMGCDNTTLMVSNGFKIWIRNVPIGGNHFTRALTKEMKLSFAKAEHLKCNATKSPDPRAVFQALRPVFNDYVSEIQRSIGFFSSVNRAAKVTKVIGLGNGFKLAGLQKFLQQNLQYEVERPETFKQLSGDAVLNSPLFVENVLSFAVPYGLALQGLELSRMRTSLLPPEIATARLIRHKKPWALATAAALLLCCLLATAANAYNYSVVHVPEFEEAEKKAAAFDQELKTGETAYNGAVGQYALQGATLNNWTLGYRGLPMHMEVYRSVLAAVPRRGLDQPLSEISKRESISILSFTSDRVADLAAWFAQLPEDLKVTSMSEADRATPPAAAPGLVFSVQGETYKYDDNPLVSDRKWIIDNFIKQLGQQFVPDPDGGKPHDLRRLGISHVVLREYSRKAEPVNIPLGDISPVPMIPGNPLPQRPAEAPKVLQRSDFLVQFIVQNYIPPAQRPPLPEAAPAAQPAPPAEPAAP